MLLTRFGAPDPGGQELHYRPCSYYIVPDHLAIKWSTESPPACRIVRKVKPPEQVEADSKPKKKAKKKAKKRRKKSGN